MSVGQERRGRHHGWRLGWSWFGGAVLDGFRSNVNGKGGSKELVYETDVVVGGQRNGCVLRLER